MEYGIVKRWGEERWGEGGRLQPLSLQPVRSGVATGRRVVSLPYALHAPVNFPTMTPRTLPSSWEDTRRSSNF